MQAARRGRCHCLCEHLLRVVEADNLRRLHLLVMRQREHARADWHLEQRARKVLRQPLECLPDERLVARPAKLPEKAVGKPSEQALVLHHAVVSLAELSDDCIRIVHDLSALHLIPRLSATCIASHITYYAITQAGGWIWDLSQIARNGIELSYFRASHFRNVSRSISVPSGRKQAISTLASLTQSVR